MAARSLLRAGRAGKKRKQQVPTHPGAPSPALPPEPFPSGLRIYAPTTPPRRPLGGHVYSGSPTTLSFLLQCPCSPARLICASRTQTEPWETRVYFEVKERQWPWGSFPGAACGAGRRQRWPNSRREQEALSKPAATQGHGQSVNQPVAKQCS